ncbi:MAG: transcription antitermination factor NusB [Candidatus Dormibacteraeota bacterium]|nr:transcription antitermination factor NusB [Candidatus Dormibacteraeota bacterium]
MTPATRPAGRRRRGRELALRVLFELEGTDKDADSVLDYQAADMHTASDVTAFAHRIVLGYLRDSRRVDGVIEEASEHWAFEDLGKVERALLRLGAYELLHESETPVAVVIDECVELAKTYAGDDAGPFVNGVLGQVASERV